MITEQSFQDTMDALDAQELFISAMMTAVMDIKGVKVGLVGIYELYDHLEREQQLKDNIAKVKEDGAELIIVIFHWGNEKKPFQTPTRPHLDILPLTLVLIWCADIILMYFKELKNTKERILYTALETSASAETAPQVTWTV